MNRYKCTKPLSIQKYDDDCFIIENEYTEIEVGEVWTEEETEYRLVSGKNSVRLTRGLDWIEIDHKTLEAYFDPVEGE